MLVLRRQGVRLDGYGFSKAAGVPERALDRGVRCGRGRIRGARHSPGVRFLFSGFPRPVAQERKPARRLPERHSIQSDDRRRRRRWRTHQCGEGRVVALRAAPGRPSRWRGAGEAGHERFRSGGRRPLGRGLLQRRGHDLDRSRESHDRLERHRGLRARRREFSQSSGRAGDDQGRARAAVPASLDPRRRPGRRRILQNGAACPGRRPESGRPRRRQRPARGRGAHRRLFPRRGPSAGEDRLDRAGRRSRGGFDGCDDDGGARPGRAVRRGDDRRTKTFLARHRALVPYHPAGRSLFAAGAGRREQKHPPDPGGRQRTDHRRNEPRRLRPPAL